MRVDVPVGLGLRCWGPGHVGTVLAPGSVAFVPLVSGLVGGGQVQTEAQIAPQEEAQHHDKAHQEEDPWEGQEQVLNKEDRVNNLQVSEVISVSLRYKSDITTGWTRNMVLTTAMVGAETVSVKR